MTCDDARTANHHDLDGRLAPAERAPWEAHLAACAGCRAHRAGLDGIGAAFAACPVVAAPSDLLAALGLADGAADAPPAPTPAAPAPVPFAAPGRRRTAGWKPLAGGLVAAALVAAVGLTFRPAADPLLVAMSPSPAIEVGADAEAILTWFDADADYVEPVTF